MWALEEPGRLVWPETAPSAAWRSFVQPHPAWQMTWPEIKRDGCDNGNAKTKKAVYCGDEGSDREKGGNHTYGTATKTRAIILCVTVTDGGEARSVMGVGQGVCSYTRGSDREEGGGDRIWRMVLKRLTARIGRRMETTTAIK